MKRHDIANEERRILVRCKVCGKMFVPKYPYGKRPGVCYDKACRVPNYEGRQGR